MNCWLVRLAVVVLVAVTITGALAEDGAPPADPPAEQPARPDAPSSPAKVLPVEQYRQLTEQLAGVVDPGQGVPLLEAFINEHPDTPQAEQAKRELVLWKERVEKNLLRFGMMWLAREEVEKKNARVEELLSAAGSAENIDAALKSFAEAARVHPHRGDIHFQKFQALMRAEREKDAAAALGPVLRIEPNNVAVMNNIGVLTARQRQLPQAFEMLLRAVGKNPDIDAVWDNLDQVMALAEEAGMPVMNLDAQMRGAIGRMHKAGKRTGETRWGNSWISEEEYAGKAKEYRQSAQRAAAIRGEIRKVQAARNKLEAEQTQLNKMHRPNAQLAAQIKQIVARIDEMDKQLSKLEDALLTAKANGPSHAEKFVLLNLDGSELESLDPAPAGRDAKLKD